MIYINTVMLLLAGLGAFMVGFKLMSDSIKTVSDGGLKRLFLKTSDNPFVGLGIGAATTALVQSSSVTTVMVVGFVNAGIMSLYQAATVIMGANIGTTITAQIAALESFNFINYAMALSAVGIFINIFAKKDKTKSVGLAFAGLGLLFLGMRFMSDSMSGIKESEAVVDLLAKINNPILLLLIGAAITALIQSSTAVTAIVISMAGAGIIIGSGGNAVYFVILGTNIGTCVTAILSSVGAGANAKRASFIHLSFNVLGSLLFCLILILWKNFSAAVMEPLFPLMTTRIAMFHTLFNVVCAAIFLPLAKVFVSVSKKIFKDKKITGEAVLLEERLLNTPSIALAQVFKEVKRAAASAMGSVETAMDGFFAVDVDKAELVNKNNEKLDRLLSEIDAYLVKLSINATSLNGEMEIASLHHILVDIKRIGELADNMDKYTRVSKEQNLTYSDNVIDDLKGMTAELKRLFELCMEYLDSRDANKLRELDEVENKVDERRKTLLDDHVRRVKEGVCKPASSSTFVNLVSNLERTGDHIYLIAHAAMRG